MTIRLTLYGPPRTKKNSSRVFRAGRGSAGRIRVMPSAAWTHWRDTATLTPGGWGVQPMVHAIEHGTIDYPVNCEAVFYRDARRGDAVGYYQGLADLLEHYGIVADDKYITSWDGSRLRVDRANPRVEIVLTRAVAEAAA